MDRFSPDLTPMASREGFFALDLVRLLGLNGHLGWLVVVCSVLDVTSNVVEFEALGA